MEIHLSKRYQYLRVGDSIQINDQIFTIKRRTTRKRSRDFESDTIRYDLWDNYVLEFDWNWKLYKIVTKRLLGFSVTSSKLIELREIGIVV